MDRIGIKSEILQYMRPDIRECIKNNVPSPDECREIRIRINRPIILKAERREIILRNEEGDEIVADKVMIENFFNAVNEYSLYAHQESIKNGFITIRGGHRIGFCGHVVMEDGRIKTMNNISALNIRISHEVKGISNNLMENLIKNDLVLNTLVLSAPGKGKTTLLRDIIRNLSNGFSSTRGRNVSVIDERSEIAACHEGEPTNDLGMRTDVIDGISKDKGIDIMLRSMSPEVLALDEIGTSKDADAIRRAGKCGCSVIATAHAWDLNDVKENPVMASLIKDGIFKRFIVINNEGEYNVCF